MRISVTVKPHAKEERVTKVDPLFLGSDDANYIVAVKERPVGGQANAAVIKALAEYFGVPPSRVHIISGHTSCRKAIEVDI